MRLAGIDAMRSLAIILVVAQHTSLMGDDKTAVDYLYKNLVANSSVFFVALSAYLAAHISWPKQRWTDFMRKKVALLLPPFVCISLLALTKAYSKCTLGFYCQDYQLIEVGLGGALFPLWYVPFIMVMFSLTPMLKLYHAQSLWLQTLVLIPLCYLSMRIGRPQELTHLAHNLLYFLPAFLLGLSCEKLQRCRSVSTALIVSLAVAAIGVWLYQSLHLQQFGNAHHPRLGFYAVDWLFVQKAMLSCVLLLLLSDLRVEQWLQRHPSLLKPLSQLAMMSFGIFFIHGLFTYELYLLTKPLAHISYVLSSVVAMALCLALACAALTIGQRLIGKRYSRYIAGY